MVKKFILLKQFTRGSNKGFTLLELLVTLVIASIITGLALKLIVDQRQLFLNDQVRTQVNQNLRASLDLVGTDIKQAGERLTNSTLPVVRVINGATVVDPDELVLQRQVLDQTLPVCQTVTGGTTQSTIEISNKAVTTGVCAFSDGDTPPNGLPDNLDQWKDYRCNKDSNPTCARPIDINRATISNRCAEENGGSDNECLWAYIYDPVNKRGEFFLYGFESPNTANNTYRIHRVDGGTWQNTYTYSAASLTNPILYILEERRYRLRPNGTTGDKVLQLILNQLDPDTKPASTNFLVDGQTSPVLLVNQLSDFQVQALMQNGNLPLTRNDFQNPATSPTTPAVDDWKQLKAIKINLIAKNPASGATKVPNLNASAQFFPRNVSSK